MMEKTNALFPSPSTMLPHNIDYWATVQHCMGEGAKFEKRFKSLRINFHDCRLNSSQLWCQVSLAVMFTFIASQSFSAFIWL